MMLLSVDFSNLHTILETLYDDMLPLCEDMMDVGKGIAGLRDARKVQETILMVGEVSDIYITNFRKMMGDSNFSAGELDAIAFGYTQLLKESNGVLQDLKQVINVSTLSMTDKDRMDVVDKCHREMRRYRNLVNYYTNKNIAVSYLRARKKNEADRVLELYGSETSKYW
jgi:hypothetical protein